MTAVAASAAGSCRSTPLAAVELFKVGGRKEAAPALRPSCLGRLRAGAASFLPPTLKSSTAASGVDLQDPAAEAATAVMVTDWRRGLLA